MVGLPPLACLSVCVSGGGGRARGVGKVRDTDPHGLYPCRAHLMRGGDFDASGKVLQQI